MPFSDNPYQSPASADESRATRATERREAEVDDYRRMARWAQMYLRLIGVLLVFEGLSGTLGGCVYMFLLRNSYEAAGNSFDLDAYSWSLIASSATMFILGLYLTLGGRWILENVFLPSPRAADEEETISAQDAEEIVDG